MQVANWTPYHSAQTKGRVMKRISFLIVKPAIIIRKPKYAIAQYCVRITLVYSYTIDVNNNTSFFGGSITIACLVHCYSSSCAQV